MDSDQVYKNKIGVRMTNMLMTAFENGQVSKADMSYLAGYILGKLDDADDSSQVFDFVLELARDWPIFAELTTPANQPVLDDNVDDALQNINAQIQDINAGKQ